MRLNFLRQQIVAIAHIESRAYLRSRRLLVAALAVTLIPAIYVAIFLASVWDPEGHRNALPVALINLDQGTRYREQGFNIGAELAAALKIRKTSIMSMPGTQDWPAGWCKEGMRPLLS